MKLDLKDVKIKLVADLQVTHPSYDRKKLMTLRAYAKGGSCFPIKQELRFKPIELSNDPAGQTVRGAREGAAYYTNYFGDAIADLISAICKNCIQIYDTRDETIDYWDSIQANADGQFNSANAQVRASLRDDFVLNRSFYVVRFVTQSEAANLGASIEAGNMDAQYKAIDALLIDDWEDGIGELDWARSYAMKLVRDGFGGPYNIELHTWMYYTDTAIVTYEARKKVGQEFATDAIATQKKYEVHELKACPIFKVDRQYDAWVGDALYPTARQLFNEESDASYYQFTTITGGLFIFTNNVGHWQKGLTLTPFGAVIAGENDKIERDKADAPTLTALKEACAERRGQMGGLIHAMARQSASQSQSGQNTSRNSEKALVKHEDPLKAFLLNFAEPQIACWRRMMTAVAKVREDEIDTMEVCGLIEEGDEDNLLSSERMAGETAYAAHPYIPTTAKEERGRQLGIEGNPDADEKTLAAIRTEKIEPPQPAEGAANGKNEGASNNARQGKAGKPKPKSKPKSRAGK